MLKALLSWNFLVWLPIYYHKSLCTLFQCHLSTMFHSIMSMRRQSLTNKDIPESDKRRTTKAMFFELFAYFQEKNYQ